jgi:hypothetical protein
MSILKQIYYCLGVGLVLAVAFGGPILAQLRQRRLKRLDRPGDVLTSLPDHNDRAVRAGLVDELQLPLRQASTGALTDDERAAWEFIAGNYHLPCQRKERK